MSFAERMWQRDLAPHDAGILRDWGSVSSNFGFYGAQLSGTSHKTTVFANRTVEGRKFGSWVGVSEKTGVQAFANIEDAMSHSNIKNTAMNRGLFRAGLRGRSFGNTVNMGVTAITAIGGYREARRNGSGVVGAAGHAGLDVGSLIMQQKLISFALGNPYAALAAGTIGGTIMLAKTAVNSVQMGNRYRQQAHLSELNGNVSQSMHNRPSATMRQRSLMSINNSQFNAMRALGNEASFTHMPKSRYGNSTYSANPVPILGY